MTIKIGRAAIGQKFLSADSKHVYTVIGYIPPEQVYKFRNLDVRDTPRPYGRYVVDSRHGDREAYIDRHGYMSGAKAYLAKHPLPV